MLGELADGAHGEAGCVDFRVLGDDDPGEFVMLASWDSEDALRAYYDTAHYRRYREQVGPLLARPSDVVVHHLAAGDTVGAARPLPARSGAVRSAIPLRSVRVPIQPLRAPQPRRGPSPRSEGAGRPLSAARRARAEARLGIAMTLIRPLRLRVCRWSSPPRRRSSRARQRSSAPPRGRHPEPAFLGPPLRRRPPHENTPSGRRAGAPAR